MPQKRRPQRKTAPLITSNREQPNLKDVYQAAQSYCAAGLSLIPISADGSKQPEFNLLPRGWSEDKQDYVRQWRVFSARRPTKAELSKWFGPSAHSRSGCGVAIVMGRISDGLEVIDVDDFQYVDRFVAEIQKRSSKLYAKLIKVKTPRPGLHIYYRSEACGGNQKLARIEDSQKPGKPKTIIEKKGEGGYCLAPPSPAQCHPSNRPYSYLDQLDLTQIPTITAAERELLLEAARALDQWRPAQIRRRPRPSKSSTRRIAGLRPGDDFDQRADWADILEPHNWKFVGANGETEHWRRPGKARGTSATVNYADADRLYVFSANADPFEQDTSYSKFQAFALLEYDGDYTNAAAALRRKGYGDAVPPTRKHRGDQKYRGITLRSRARKK